MPKGNYSYLSDNESGFAISEPGSCYSRSNYSNDSGYDREGVQAKEPDRPGTTRRASSGRGRSRVEDEMESEGQTRNMQRNSGRRGGQARRASDRNPARRMTGAETRTSRQKKSRRGFAAMSPEQQREIARKGGLTVSRNRRHMADIGRVGGEHSHGGRRARARR